MEKNKEIVVINKKEEVEGYSVCETSSKKCQLDCIWPAPAQAFSYNN